MGLSRARRGASESDAAFEENGTRLAGTSHLGGAFGSVVSFARDYYGNARAQWHASGGGFPDADQPQPAGRKHPKCTS